MANVKRMQCKDIPDAMFLAAVDEAACNSGLSVGLVWDVRHELGGLPRNLVLAKARKLIARGLLDGCGCGCRGDFQVIPQPEPVVAYRVTATEWEHGWVLAIHDVGITQCVDQEEAVAVIQDYLELDGRDITGPITIKWVTP